MSSRDPTSSGAPDQGRGRPSGGRSRPRLRASLLAIAVLMAFSTVTARVIVDRAFDSIPLPQDVKLPSSSQVFDAKGRYIASFSDEVTRFLIDTDQLPDHVGRAVVAAEDRDFYKHEGVSIKGTIRAAWENVTNAEVRQGGSTISQQYIKNAVLQDPARTVERKFKEVILSAKLEERYSKDEILGFYLNTVYFGRGTYGIEAAARAYFNKHARGLTLSEAAYLAGIIPSPDRYQPDQEPKAASARRDLVLGIMADEGYITEREERRAARGKVELKSGIKVPDHRRQPAAYFLEWIRKEYLYPRFGDCLYRCGLKIYTTLDMAMQKAAEDSIASMLTGKGMPQASLVSMTPDGAVRAFVGGRAFERVRKARGFNFASDLRRQAGSAFKPFTLLAALEQDISTQSRFAGHSPKTIFDDICTGPEGVWEPENFDGASYGTITLDEATANSVNTVYAELIAEIGPDKVADVLQRLGFRGPNNKRRVPPTCSLALGTLDVSAVQMVRSFAALAGGGRLPKVRAVRYVLDGDGECLHKFESKEDLECAKSDVVEPRPVIDDDAAYTLTDALTGVVEYGTGTAAAIGRPAAGKTGTTQDHRDAWFAGYVPQLATVVWMGYPVAPGPDGKLRTEDDFTPRMEYCGAPRACRPVESIEVTGGSFPAQIWAAFMTSALEGEPVEYFPVADDPPGTVLNPLPPPPEPEPDDEDKRSNDDKSSRGPDNGNGEKGKGKGD